MRSVWSGMITFGPITLPVRLYPAAERHATPSAHLVHAADGGAIRYLKTCELEQREVSNEEIVKQYESRDGTPVVLEDRDLDDLPVSSKRTIRILAVVPTADIDPMMFAQPYYVGLGNRTPGLPYAMLRETLRRSDKVAVAKVAIHGREHLSVLRVDDRSEALVLQLLYWPDQMQRPTGLAPDTTVEVSEKEIELSRTLLDILSEDFRLEDQHDEYREALEEAIEAKAEGVELPRERPAPRPSNVIDFTEVLQRSIAAARREEGRGAAADEEAAAAAGGEETQEEARASGRRASSSRRESAKKTAAPKKTATSTARKTATAKKSASGSGAKKAAKKTSSGGSSGTKKTASSSRRRTG